MVYIEWGRLGEIGDLYVLPEARGNGIARRLVQAAIDWRRARGCSAVEATTTPLGEAAHGLRAVSIRALVLPPLGELFRFCDLTESPHFRRSTRRSHRLGSAGALVSTDLHCQNMSKAAISASTWRSSGECRLRRNPPTRIQLLGISYAI